MIKICVFTGTRAEYGLLEPLMRALKNQKKYELQILVSGSHLSEIHGNTYQEIENDGFAITEKIEILSNDNSELAVAQATGTAVYKYAEAFTRMTPNYLIVLGDRYESFAAAVAAFTIKIPVVHISGGDVTEGALDDAFRHSITKMASLHFTSTETYRKRVIQLGEQPQTVFNVGATGIDNIINIKTLSIKELSASLNFEIKSNYFLVTFHPITLENNSSENQISELLLSLSTFTDFQIIFTMPNADADSKIIIEKIKTFVKTDPEKYVLFNSLGQKRYLSVMKNAKCVIGNSSSGIIETPSYQIPTVNIGDRQKGRLRAESVIDCEPTQNEIKKAISKAISPSFQEFCKTVINVYGDGKAVEKIINILEVELPKINLKKGFYDAR